MPFRPLSDHELQLLADEQLIDYVRAGRGAGDLDAARRGLMFLVYGYQRTVRMRLRLRVPSGAVDDLAGEAIARAVMAAFDGSSVGQFRSWMNTIVDRTAVDFFRRRDARPEEVPMPGEGEDDDGPWRAEPSVASETGAIELRIIIGEVFAELSAPHQQVVELHVFGALPASEVCERIEGMSPDNVAQIASRFRTALRRRLEEGHTG